MFKDLFINACILIAAISLGNEIFRLRLFHHASKFSLGFLSGLLGICLVFFSLKIGETLVDFRNLAVILASLYGGFIASIMAALVIGLFRITYYGLSHSSLIAFATILLVSIGVSLIVKQQFVRWKKWFFVSTYSLIISSIFLMIALKDNSNLLEVFVPYWVGTCLVSVILYIYTGHLETYNALFFRFKKEASFDFLTGLKNFREFDQVLNSEAAIARENKESLSLLLIDIDFFKRINDTYGHVEGDIVLKQLGELLRSSCKKSDPVFRNGGEEFSVILPGCSVEKALDVANRIRNNVEKHTFQLTNGSQIQITVSVGVTTYPELVSDVSLLVERADNALYQAKRSGRNRVEVL